MPGNVLGYCGKMQYIFLAYALFINNYIYLIGKIK